MAYGSADEERLVASSLAVARVHVCRQDTANDVAQMRQVVRVGQGAGDEDVALPLDGEDRVGGASHCKAGQRRRGARGVIGCSMCCLYVQWLRVA